MPLMPLLLVAPPLPSLADFPRHASLGDCDESTLAPRLKGSRDEVALGMRFMVWGNSPF